VSDPSVRFEEIDSAVLQRIQEALQRQDPGGSKLEVFADGVMRRGNRLYVPVHPVGQPSTMFSFFHAVASAEVELRDQGLDVQLTPEYPQPYVVVANISGEHSPYIFLSKEGAEYDNLAELLGRDPSWTRQFVTIEGYPYEGPEDLATALREALYEHPEAKRLNI